MKELNYVEQKMLTLRLRDLADSSTSQYGKRLVKSRGSRPAYTATAFGGDSGFFSTMASTNFISTQISYSKWLLSQLLNRYIYIHICGTLVQ